MEMCICGHLEREHDPTGECRAAGCRCKHFKPEIRLPSSAAGLAEHGRAHCPRYEADRADHKRDSYLRSRYARKGLSCSRIRLPSRTKSPASSRRLSAKDTRGREAPTMAASSS